LLGIEGLGQNKCQPENIYITDSVGQGNIKIPQKFIHKISEDRVLMFLSDTTKRPLISFRIVKSGCGGEFKPGLYTIQLDLVVENRSELLEAKLKIRCNYLGAYQIELLYPNKEDRIFYIDQQKAYFRNKTKP
jgi:hypothetical protein